MVPFPNFVTVVPDIPRSQLKEIIENAVACTQDADITTNPDCGSGRFAQVAGFGVSWDPIFTAQIVDDDGNVLTAGARVRDVTLDDGTPIVVGGVVQAGDPIAIAIVDFSGRGGDQYPFRGAPFTVLGMSYQQALFNYITASAADGGLAGTITAAQYPKGGDPDPAPVTMATSFSSHFIAVPPFTRKLPLRAKRRPL